MGSQTIGMQPHSLDGQHPVGLTRAAIQKALVDPEEVDLSWLPSLSSSNGWAMALDALRFLSILVKHLKPQHILEFGSGLSTQVLKNACASLLPPCHISSVDHDPEFGETVKAFPAKPISSCLVSFQFAPLVARDFGGKTLPTYHLQAEQFASQRPVDLVIIDGPPVVLGGREGILYQAMEYARPGTLVLLDDAKRVEEQMAISRWKEVLGDSIEGSLIPGFFKGLVAIIVHEPLKRSDLLARRLQASAQDIATIIPREHLFIVVGDEWWNTQIAPGRGAIPFPARNGQYWGAPPDDSTAIRELERLRKSEAKFLILGWPYFWWLDFYPELARYLFKEFRNVLKNDRLIVFDIRH